jgi:hypothetical protein
MTILVLDDKSETPKSLDVNDFAEESPMLARCPKVVLDIGHAACRTRLEFDVLRQSINV